MARSRRGSSVGRTRGCLEAGKRYGNFGQGAGIEADDVGLAAAALGNDRSAMWVIRAFEVVDGVLLQRLASEFDIPQSHQFVSFQAAIRNNSVMNLL